MFGDILYFLLFGYLSLLGLFDAFGTFDGFYNSFDKYEKNGLNTVIAPILNPPEVKEVLFEKLKCTNYSDTGF